MLRQFDGTHVADSLPPPQRDVFKFPAADGDGAQAGVSDVRRFDALGLFVELDPAAVGVEVQGFKVRAGSSDEVEVGVGDGRGGLEGGEIGEAGKESGEVMGVEDAEGGTGEGLDAAPPPADAGAGLAVPPTDDAPQHQPQLVVAESLHHPRLLLNTSHKAEQVTIKWRLKLTRVKFNEHRPEKTSPIIAQIIVENPMYSSS